MFFVSTVDELRSGWEWLLSAAIAGVFLFLGRAALAQGKESPRLELKVDQVGYPLDGAKDRAGRRCGRKSL